MGLGIGKGDPTLDEVWDKARFLRLTRGRWPRDSQDLVLIDRCPEAWAALGLIDRLGWEIALTVVEEMSSD